jgi:hypothetical protein
MVHKGLFPRVNWMSTSCCFQHHSQPRQINDLEFSESKQSVPKLMLITGHIAKVRSGTEATWGLEVWCTRIFAAIDRERARGHAIGG